MVRFDHLDQILLGFDFLRKTLLCFVLRENFDFVWPISDMFRLSRPKFERFFKEFCWTSHWFVSSLSTINGYTWSVLDLCFGFLDFLDNQITGVNRQKIIMYAFRLMILELSYRENLKFFNRKQVLLNLNLSMLILLSLQFALKL